MKHHRPSPKPPEDIAALSSNGRHLLRLLTTTDLHMNLDGYDYCADRVSLPTGLTRIGPMISAARTEAEALGGSVMVLDNGDGLQGTPMADVMAAQVDTPHPLMQVFRQLDYTALGLGNHDFNFGLQTLTRILDQSACPVVVSNLRWIGQAPPMRWRDHLIIDREIPRPGGPKRLRIGLVAFVPTEILIWDSHLLRNRIEIDDIIDSARSWVPLLKSEGCDIVVVLAHAGLGIPVHHPDPVDILKELATIEGVDAIIGGHTHKRFPGKDHATLEGVDATHGSVAGVPSVMAGHSGAYLGQLDLLLDGSGPGWVSEGFHSQLLRVAPRTGLPAPEDPELREIVAPSRLLVRDALSAPVGQVSHHIHSYFGSFGPDPAMELIARSSANALSILLQDTEWADLPILAATSPQGSEFEAGGRGYSDIPPGPVSLRHVSDLCAFPDALNAVVLTGADIAEWLEHSAGIFERISPGAKGQRLLRPAVPPYEFDVIFGLTYQIDPTRPARYAPSGRMISRAAHRVSNPRFAGEIIDPKARFVVALSSYRANGGGNIKGLRRAAHISLPRLLVSEAVRTYLSHPNERQANIFEGAGYPWRFAPCPDTSVHVNTGMGATDHLDMLSDFSRVVVRPQPEIGTLVLSLGLPATASPAKI